MSQGKKTLVLRRLLAAHEAWFDVSQDYFFAGRSFDGYAEFRSKDCKYLVSKKAVIWEANSFEYLFFKLEDRLTCAVAKDYIAFMRDEGLKKVRPERNHMCSFVSLVFVVDSCDEGVRDVIRKTCFRKNFLLGLRGWADLRFAVVDLGACAIISNAAAKNMRSALAANAGFEGA